MTFTQAMLTALLVVSWMRHRNRYPAREPGQKRQWAATIAEMVEGVALLLFYAFLWWLLDAGKVLP